MRLRLPSLAALFGLFVAVPVALAPPRSFDLLFHLASGRHLLAHGFVDRDPFGFTASGGWFPHEWAFGVAAELSVRAFGAAGPQLVTASLLLGFFLLLWRALGRDRGLFAVSAFVLALAAQSYTWEEARPFHVGHVLFTIAVLLVQHTRAGVEVAAWLVAPLTCAWASLHGSWLLGPALVAGTALGLMIEGRRREAARGAGAALVAWLAAGLSPGGLRTLTYPIEHALLPSTQTIQEWQPLEPDRWAAALVALALAAALLSRRRRAGEPLRASLVLPAGVLFAATLPTQRHAPFAAILLAAAVAELAPNMSPAETSLGRALVRIDTALRRWSTGAGGAIVPLFVIGLVALRAAFAPQPIADALPRDEFPMTALAALAEAPPGHVLPRFQWGGAVSYLAGDGHPVFIDARNDPYPRAIHDDYRTLALVEPGWERVLERHAIQYVLWGPAGYGARLLDALRRTPGWRVVAEDATGTLFARE